MKIVNNIVLVAPDSADPNLVDSSTPDKRVMETKYYILFIWGLVDPNIMGPYDTPDERNEAVLELVAENGIDEHSYLKVDVTGNLPVIDGFSEEELYGKE